MTFPIPERAMSSHIAVLGMTGGGKSNSARVVVEHGYTLGDHICIFDTVKSDWRGIVSSFDGLSEGLPFTILGGPYGHVPLHPNAGAQIAELIATGKLPYSVLDTRQFPMGGLQRFFNEFAPVILDRNQHVLRLVFEEAHELAPKEKAGIAGEHMGVYHMKKLATAGRSQGLRLMFNTQRVQSLHNAALGSCSTVIAHRLQYPADQEPVVKWLSGTVKDKAKVREIEASMSTLADGEAWVCSGIGQVLERRQMPRMRTFDSGGTPKHGSNQRGPVVSAQVDVEALRALIGTAQAEATATSESGKMNKAGNTAAELAEARRAGELDGYARGRKEGILAGALLGRKEAAALLTELAHRLTSEVPTVTIHPQGDREPATNEALHSMARQVAKAITEPAAGGDRGRSAPSQTRAATSPETRAVTGAASSSSTGGATRRMMIALAQNPAGLTHRKLGILADVSPGGSTWRGVMAGFRKERFVEESGDVIKATREGLRWLGKYEPLPTGNALREYWQQKIGNSTRGQVFAEILAGGGRPVPAAQVARNAGVELGGSTWRGHMAFLRGLELVSGSTELRAAAELFES